MSPSDAHAAPEPSNETRQVADPARGPGEIAKNLLTPTGVSIVTALAAGAALYAWQGRATGILGGGLSFFVVWVVSNIALGLPPPERPAPLPAAPRSVSLGRSGESAAGAGEPQHE